MQNSQVQLFRPPIPVRRSYAIGVTERTLGFGLRCFFVWHICLSVLGDVSHAPRLLEIFGMHPALRDAGKLEFFFSLESLRGRQTFLGYLAPTRTTEWVVYAKRPFAGPEQVLDYVGRYTHRVAISNNRASTSEMLCSPNSKVEAA